MNTLTEEERDAIWFPYVVYNNVRSKDEYKPTDKFDILGVIPSSDFNYVTKDNMHIFKGSENALSFTRERNIIWKCDYDYTWYPFDTQHCYINISLEGNSKNFVNLGRFLYRCWKLFFRQRGQINNKKNKPAPGNAHYQGPIDLAHYYIKVRNNRSRCVIFLFRITALSKEMERSVWSSVWEDDFSVRA